MSSHLWKLTQKKTYDFLSHRHGTITAIAAITFVLVSAFQFGEVLIEWSSDKYAAVFNSFSDNVAGKSYQKRLCLPVPIDIVYTWVNGSDPKLINELRKFKSNLGNEIQENATSFSDKCPFAHCVLSKWVYLEPALPPLASISNMAIWYPEFKHAEKLIQITGDSNGTVILMDSHESLSKILNSTMYIDGINVTLKQCYYTSDWKLPSSHLLEDTIILNGIPAEKAPDQLKQKLPSDMANMINQVEIFEEVGIAILDVSKYNHKQILKAYGNLTIEGKASSIISASLVWDLSVNSENDISANRFQDNEELRYSLRSIEKYAPWVRHIYIVTNGQIPHWLNLDNPRLSIITHEEIFPNQNHLPTFSSPAIESHLHRIPGLSKKFIYFNDDVMFGKEVWPDDFYTHAHGQKVYLSWPVPDCQSGCPSSWIKDGYCDKTCNNSECEWDGGDCSGVLSNTFSFGNAVNIGPESSSYCSSGCANYWLADRYCDQSCNVLPCGFDVGDCGTDAYDRLYGIQLFWNQTTYKLPPGLTVAYINLTSFFGLDMVIHDAWYDESPVIRISAVSKKFQVMTLLLNSGHNDTVLNFTISGERTNGTDVQQHNFSLVVSTLALTDETKLPTSVKETKIYHTNDYEITYFEGIKHEYLGPKPATVANKVLLQDVNMSMYKLPPKISQELDKLLLQLYQDELTVKGFNIRQSDLWIQFSKWLNGSKPEMHRLNISESGLSFTANSNVDYLQNKSQVKKQYTNISDMKASQLPPTPVDDKEEKPQSKIEPDKVLQHRTDLDVKKDEVGDILNEMNHTHTENHISTPEKNEKQEDLMMKSTKIKEDLVYKGRHLNNFEDMIFNESQPVFKIVPETIGFLPWERRNVFYDLQKKLYGKERMEEYQAGHLRSRRMLDTYGDSLRRVNKLFNKRFGFKPRKVPGHVPHMVDKDIMQELQDIYADEWDLTSSHKMRMPNDMQFAFSYLYYMMSEQANRTTGDVFDMMDTDQSGVLSDRELRTLATQLYDLPLDLQTLTGLETKFKSCSAELAAEGIEEPPKQEVYYDKEMPQVTKLLFLQCKEVMEVVVDKFPVGLKYKHEIKSEDDIAFKMIGSNVSIVVGQLDDIRKNPKKFICLNDNIDHTKEDSQMVKAVLMDFYESILPIPSSFELPNEYRNRFLHMAELREWRKYRDWLRLWTHSALFLLVIYTIGSYYSDKLIAVQRRLFGRHFMITFNEATSQTSKSISKQGIAIDV